MHTLPVKTKAWIQSQFGIIFDLYSNWSASLSLHKQAAWSPKWTCEEKNNSCISFWKKKKKIKEKCLAELRTDWIQACVSGPVLQAAGLDQVRTLLVDIWNIYHQKYLLLNFENNKSHIPAENYNFRQRS